MAKLTNIIILLLTTLTLSNGIPMKRSLNKLRSLQLSTNLDFIEAYDLTYKDKKWSFKIRTDTVLPNQSNVLVDILVYKSLTSYDTASCIYNNKILSCVRNGYSQSDTELVKLNFIQYQGTVTWNNIKKKELKIPLNTKMTFSKAYGKFFTNKWNFMIDAQLIGAIPKYSLAYIDILHNSVETTATCEIIGGYAKDYTNISCISDYGTQAEDDIIKINPKKKYGTIEWSTALKSYDTYIEEITEGSDISLQFYDAYDLYYENNKWAFTIWAKSDKKENPGKQYITDIYFIGKKQQRASTATCLLKEVRESYLPIILNCVCNYASQTETDLVQLEYPKSEASTITWKSGISERYKITLKTSLTLVKAYNLKFAKTWSFNIDVADGILPVDSKVIIDVYHMDTSKKVNCTSTSNTLIVCETTLNQDRIVSLSQEKSLDSSVEWKNNLQGDYRIYLDETLSYRGAYNMTFNDTDNKWHFVIDAANPKYGSKIITDILYGDKSSTATCINENTKLVFYCVVDEKDQDKRTLVKMNSIKSSYSTVAWNDLTTDDDIILLTDLTLSKTGYLKTSPKDSQTWIFDLYVEEEYIPENAIIIVDIHYLNYYTIMGNGVENEGKSTAKCVYTYKKLTCEADSRIKGYEYSISLSLEKKEGSSSSVRTWKNKDNYINKNVPILLIASLNYHYCTHIQMLEGTYIFYCHFHISTKIPKNSEVLIDILVEDKPSISHCKAENHTFIKCEIKNEDYKAEKNYIAYKKTKQSTITWNYLEQNQYLFPIELEYVHAYKASSTILDTTYPFLMLAKGDKLKDGLRFSVKILHKMNEKEGSPKTNYEDDAPCEVYGGIVFCWWYSYNRRIDHVLDNYYLLLRKDGDYIKWTNPGQYKFEEDFNINLQFKNLISIDYNSENERYEFSLNVIGNYNSEHPHIILDLLIEKHERYAYCSASKEDNSIINCHTEKIPYKKSTVIELRKESHLGNTFWSNLSENKKLNGEEIYYVLSDKVYDLKFESNKWKFIIKPERVDTFTGTKKLDILINEVPGYANCEINAEELLICEVDSDNQKDTDLIRFYEDNPNSDSPIHMTFMENDGIPLNINLEFIQTYDLKFDLEKQNWFFKIKAKVDDSIVIPEGSTFSTGITYTEYNDRVAFCTQDGNIESNIIVLLCRPEFKVKEEFVISLSNENSVYSSIKWTKPISLDDISIIYSTDLDVIKVDNLKYDATENKWYFNMIVSSTNLPVNSKVKIDLIYKGEDTTGTCILKENNKFLCSPGTENQNSDDKFTISPTKKNGSVTYLNKNIKLKFEIELTYEKYYDLKYADQNWEFKIKLSESNMENDDSIFIDIIVDGLYNYANCVLNSNILSCQLIQDTQTFKNKIQLYNNKQNTNLKWKDLPDVVDMYMTYKIQLINIYGGFHDNKWKFNICHEAIDPKQKIYDNYVLLDILVNNAESIALCKITSHSFLKCVSNHKNQKKDDVVKISGNKTPNLGTVFFEEDLNDDEKNINPVSLPVTYKSVSYELVGYEFQFEIKGSLSKGIDYEIEEDTYTEIEIVSYKNKEEKKFEVVCLTNYILPDKLSTVYLYCATEEDVSDSDSLVVNVDSKGYSKYIKFSPIKNIEIISEEPPETIPTDKLQKDIDEPPETIKTDKLQKDIDDELDELENGSRRKNLSLFGLLLFLLLL